MRFFSMQTAIAALAVAGFMLPASTMAATQQVRVTVTNLSGANGASLTPFFIGLHDGSFDAFNAGSAASSAIQAVAETGNVSGLTSNFAASHPNGIGTTVTASVNGFGPGVYLPGGSGSVTLTLDSMQHRYLSYFSMVVPSNDRFVGNDSPMEFQLFDSNGVFQPGVLTENGSSIWDAGTEVDGAFGPAFVVGANAGDNTPQNGLIGLNTDFSLYNGVATPAGYNFTNTPGVGTPVFSIAVSAVPVPAAVWLFGSVLPMLGLMRRRQRNAV